MNDDRIRPDGPPSGVAALETMGLVRRYPGTRALDDVSIRISDGEILGLAGHNGAGKSTLTRVLAGADTPDSGTILLRGEEVSLKSPDDALRRGIALVPQSLMVVPNLTVRENLLLGSRSPWFRRSEEEDRDRPGPAGARSRAATLDAVAATLELSQYLDRLVARVRPVTQRLVMIARVLLRSPHLIILDEPTANLPAREVDLLFSVIRPLARQHASIIYVSHRLDELLALTDRIVVMRQGKVLDDRPTGSVKKGELAALIAGADLRDETQKLRSEVDVASTATSSSRSETGDELLRCENFGAMPNTRGITFTLRPGEILGLAGLDGSGRTSLLRSIWGDRRRTDGQLYVKGVPVEIGKPRDAIDAGIAYLPEDRAHAVFPEMRVVENVTLPSLSRFARWMGIVSRTTEVSEVRTLLERLDLRPRSERAVYSKTGTLSGGNQQKVIIARWLLRGADIFLFDEPTQGIDVGAREQVYEIIRELAAGGAGVVVSSSEPEEIVRLCKTVLVMRDGTLAMTLTGSEVSEAEISRACLGEVRQVRTDGGGANEGVSQVRVADDCSAAGDGDELSGS